MGVFDRIEEKVMETKERVLDTVREARDRVLGNETARSVGEGLRDAKERAGGAVADVYARTQQVRDAVAGPPDALSLLKKDHELANGLFDQLDATKGQARDLREGLFSQLKYELGTHASIEERLFYPTIRKAAEGRALVLEAYQEHRVMKQLLAELASRPLMGEEWEAKLTVLKENVQHHVREEENELFQVAREVMSADQLQDLGRRMEQEKQALAAAGKPDEADDAEAITGTVRTTPIKDEAGADFKRSAT